MAKWRKEESLKWQNGEMAKRGGDRGGGGEEEVEVSEGRRRRRRRKAGGGGELATIDGTTNGRWWFGRRPMGSQPITAMLT